MPCRLRMLHEHLLSRDDLTTVSEATRLAGAGKLDAATRTRDHIRDPLGRKVAEWVILRSDGDNEFARYANFIRTNPAWPGMTLLQRRAEARLWIERADAATVRALLRRPRTTHRTRAIGDGARDCIARRCPRSPLCQRGMAQRGFLGKHRSRVLKSVRPAPDPGRSCGTHA